MIIAADNLDILDPGIAGAIAALEPFKVAHILPLARQFPSDIIGCLLYPNRHVPISHDGMMGVKVFSRVEI